MKLVRPLPDEIMAMSEEETACQYCGISYLILNKCEKMEQLVREMEVERDSLRVRVSFEIFEAKLDFYFSFLSRKDRLYWH